MHIESTVRQFRLFMIAILSSASLLEERLIDLDRQNRKQHKPTLHTAAAVEKQNTYLKYAADGGTSPQTNKSRLTTHLIR